MFPRAVRGTYFIFIAMRCWTLVSITPTSFSSSKSDNTVGASCEVLLVLSCRGMSDRIHSKSPPYAGIGLLGYIFFQYLNMRLISLFLPISRLSTCHESFKKSISAVRGEYYPGLKLGSIIMEWLRTITTFGRCVW